MKANNIKTVLIAIDYSPTAQKVAEAGYTLAYNMAAEVTLLHVIADPVYYSATGYSPIMGYWGYLDNDPLQVDIHESIKKECQYFLDKTKLHLDDNNIQTLLVQGDCATAILEQAKKTEADIVVLGSHSRRWLDDILMGSIAEKVLRHAQTPLYIIPTKKHA